jgi:D-alanine-D-alanine ligase
MSYLQPAQLDSALLSEVQQLALAAHNAINSLDVSRVDIRCDEAGIPYLLEINTLPGMSPGFSDLPIAADLIGMDYNWLVNTILNLACQRYGLAAPEPLIPASQLLTR